MIREKIKTGNGDIYRLASEFNCSPSQIAGIKVPRDGVKPRRRSVLSGRSVWRVEA